MDPKYTAKVIENIKTKPGCWNYLTIGVFDDDKQIGSYQRNYSDFLNTFFPFKQNNQWFALYSPKYTATRIMSLPDCKDIGGEEEEQWGFCPVEYLVPSYYIHKADIKHEEIAFRVYDTEGEEETPEELKKRDILFDPFGFVAGCVWGDDSSWKIQFLDLSEAHKGIIKRDERFGFLELPRRMRLKDAVQWDGDFLLTFATQKHFHVDEKTMNVKKEFKDE